MSIHTLQRLLKVKHLLNYEHLLTNIPLLLLYFCNADSKWTNYVQEYLNPTNETDKRELGGYCPNKPAPDDDTFDSATSKGVRNA
jgi:hypothetical protein